MDERRDRNDLHSSNGANDKNVIKKYKFIVVHEDGTKEDLSEKMSIEEIREFLRSKGLEEEAKAITSENVHPVNESAAGEKDNIESLNSLVDSYLSNVSEDAKDYNGNETIDDTANIDDLVDDIYDEYMSNPSNGSSDSYEEEEPDEEDLDDEDWEDEDNSLIVLDGDNSSEDIDDEEDWEMDDEVCPICGSRDIDELERGKITVSVAGGLFGATRKGVVKTFLPNVVSHGIGGVIGYALGNVAGRVLDKKVLNNRKCAHCGYEWHVDEDLF